jgi:acyl-CoA synthetase (AMP-forming)/AMP-acid ligase II
MTSPSARIYPSPLPDVTIPDGAVPDYVLRGCAELADRPALVDGLSGDTISYAELKFYVNRVASGLAARGLKRGERIAVFSPNTIWYPVLFHGIAAAGGVSTTINSLYTPDEIAFQLRDSGARFLYTVSRFLDRAQAAVAKQSVDEIVVLDGSEGYASLRDVMTNGGPVPELTVDPAEGLVTLPYSSGTTGLPKGVMLTHRNLVGNVAQSEAILGKLGEEERVIAVLPFSHIYGLNVLMNLTLSIGATLVTLPRFDLEQFLRAIQDQRVTRAFVAPPIVIAMVKHPLVDKFDLSSLRTMLSGAAPLDEELAWGAEKRLGVRVTQGYGMTELSPASHATPDNVDAPKGSVGLSIPNTECRLVDAATGADVEEGEPGELWIRGPQVMKGYLNNPEATEATIDKDGWLHTGDIATRDGHGYYTIVDRLKELIKYKGYQVAPAELEGHLLKHPQIADAAVIGVPDEEGGEAPKAFVVPAPGARLTAQDVITYIAGVVAPYKKVRYVEFIDAIPKATSGKILRKDLRSSVTT